MTISGDAQTGIFADCLTAKFDSTAPVQAATPLARAWALVTSFSAEQTERKRPFRRRAQRNLKSDEIPHNSINQNPDVQMLEFQPEIKRRRVGRDTGDGENGTAEDEHKEGLLSSNTHVKWPVVRATKAELDATCARWCRVLEDGSYSWDMNNLKCFLAQEERDDRLLVRNIIHGTILSGQVHPLIFDAASEHDHEMVRLRSVPFLEQLLADERKGVPTYPSLSDEQKSLVAVGVRDLFLAKRHGFLDEREKRILDGMVGLLDETLGCVHAVDMNISFHPSTNFTVVKVIENLDDMMGNGWKEWGPLFAQVMDAPRLFVVFVDPVECKKPNNSITRRQTANNCPF
jgi:hypothetical protein